VTDEQIDALIESVKPNLRAAIRASFAPTFAPAHFLIMGTIPLPSGQEWKLVLAVMSEPTAEIVGTLVLQGVPGMTAAWQKMASPPAAGFSAPGL
jgi:hypothetical protein